MSNDENREKNEEKAAVPVQPIIDMGSTVVKNSRGTIHCLTIVWQVEGHTLLPDAPPIPSLRRCALSSFCCQPILMAHKTTAPLKRF